MKALANHCATHSLQGFAAYRLGNKAVELTMVPELGAKIISLKDRHTGRDWLWHPPDGLKLFRNASGDDFSHSPLAGVDECLPTIAPCSWQGRALPDHGEIWSANCKVDATAWEAGLLKTSARLKISPFAFERTLELRENEILLTYRLTNCGTAPERFLWAVHPLLRLAPGDQLDLPSSTQTLLPARAWIDNLATNALNGACAKAFATPLTEGLAAIQNSATGDRLEFAWNPEENNTLGLWLTRGGWHGHEHFAIEPTNVAGDALTEAGQQGGVIEPGAVANWQISIRVGG